LRGAQFPAGTAEFVGQPGVSHGALETLGYSQPQIRAEERPIDVLFVFGYDRVD
jgi:hypothetical protein